MTRYFILVFIASFFSEANSQQSLNVNFLGGWNDPSLPVHSGVRYNDIWGYADGNKEFAIVGTSTKVLFLDVTNPTQVSLVAAIQPPGNPSTIWRDMKTYGSYAYAVADEQSEGLLVFDLTNIADEHNPTVTLIEQQTDVFTRAHNIYVDYTGYLYVAGANVSGGSLLIYDVISNPASPTFVQGVSLPGGYVHDVYVQNHIAYCSHGNSGFFVYNMSSATTGGGVSELGRLTGYGGGPAYNHSSWTKGDYVIFADETHGQPLKVVDASTLSEMEIVETFQSNLLGVGNPTSSSGSIPHNPFVYGDLCIVSYYHDGVVFYDISDPENVSMAGYYDTEPGNTNYSGYQGCWGVFPYLPSGRIIASDVLNGLSILDASAAFSLLPVQWTKVDAQAEQKQIKVSWSTATENNNKGFWVQRQNNKKVFENLGFVEPEVDGTYVFWDNEPLLTKNHYRIAQEDFDGTISYSTIVSASLNIHDSEWTIAPNPAPSGGQIYLKAAKALPLEVDLFDEQGRLLQQYHYATPALEHTLVLPSVAAGVYYFQGDMGEQLQFIVH